ncbi:MAG: mechanosensitive ion channel [Longimicrobiales bacterium]|nr:mechanosensitive ion channel [Longimicrobiales bacterium]
MASRLRRFSAVLILAAAGCTFFGTDAADDATIEDTATVVSDSLAESGEEGSAPDSLVANADPGAEAPIVPALDVLPVQALDTLGFLLDRLDSLLTGQQALSARLDSLAAASPLTTADSAVADSARSGLASTEVLGQAGQSVRSFTIATVLSVLVIILFNLLIRGAVWLLDALAERQPRRRLFYKRLVPITRIVLWIFAAYLIVRVIFQIDAEGLFAAAAAIGVAVGFAAQDLLKNLFGGLILVFDQPFQVGDKVRVGETYGEVVSIGLRSTRIVTPDDNLVSVPNSQVVDQQVANANAGELNCQVVTDLYLPGWADEDSAKRIAFQAASSSKYVYLNKPIVVLVGDVFKETFLTRVRVKAYVLDPRFEFLLQSDITERARAGFREAGLLQTSHMQTWLVDQALHQASKAGSEETASAPAPETDGDPDEAGTPARGGSA